MRTAIIFLTLTIVLFVFHALGWETVEISDFLGIILGIGTGIGITMAIFLDVLEIKNRLT